MAKDNRREPSGAGRPLPPLAYCRLILASHPSQFGWLLFGFGMIFVWALGVKGDYRDLGLFPGERVTTVGVVTNSEVTNGSEKESEIYANSYTFAGPDG